MVWNLECPLLKSSFRTWIVKSRFSRAEIKKKRIESCLLAKIIKTNGRQVTNKAKQENIADEEWNLRRGRSEIRSFVTSPWISVQSGYARRFFYIGSRLYMHKHWYLSICLFICLCRLGVLKRLRCDDVLKI